jgi:hypothetical protein
MSQFPFLAALALFLAGEQLNAKSVIVDDGDTGQIIYSSGWDLGNNCPGCFAKPDPTLPFQGTWHECVWKRCIPIWD